MSEETPKKITHGQARRSLQRFIDAHFNSCSPDRGVKTCIPAEPDDDDVFLMDYITQQEAKGE